MDNFLLLALPASEQSQLWDRTNTFISRAGRWRAYCNLMSLAATLSWLQEDYPDTFKLIPRIPQILPAWETVNGSAIALNGIRIALIPSDALDRDELRVPREWLDDPSLAVSYYVAVQVKPEDGTVLLWGYTTQAQLRGKGVYTNRDRRWPIGDHRSYCLCASALFTDIASLLVALQLCPRPS